MFSALLIVSLPFLDHPPPNPAGQLVKSVHQALASFICERTTKPVLPVFSFTVFAAWTSSSKVVGGVTPASAMIFLFQNRAYGDVSPVSYTHLRAHETRHDLVCRLLLEKKKK